MTAPMPETMSPREKVELKPCPFCGGDAVAGSNFDNDHYVMCGADCDRCGGMVGYMKTEMAAIENWNRRTALASGSGDHAELARLAESATPGPWFETEGHPSGRTYGIHAEAGPVVVFRGIAKPHGQGEHNAAFIAAANPATVLALLAENAALNDYGRDVAKEALEYRNRATEAERKLAEAVGVLRDLSSWFDGAAHNGAWIIRSGDLGADDAICAARTFLSKEAERG